MGLRAWILGTCLTLAGAAPAAAQLRDVRVASEGERAVVTLTLAAPPTHAAAMPILDGFMVQVAGVSGADIAFESAQTDLVRRIEMRAQPNGAALALFTRTEILAARAQLDGGSVRVELDLAETVQTSPSASAAAVTPPAPVAPSQPPPREDPAAVLAGGPQDEPEPRADQASAAAEVSAAIAEAYAQAAEGSEVPAEEGGVAGDVTPLAEDRSGHAADPATEDTAESAPDPVSPGSDGAPARLTGEPPVAPVSVGDAAALYAAHLDAEACEGAEMGVRTDPWDLDSLSDFGACLLREGDIGQATLVFERLLSIEPEDVEAHLGLGVASQEAGEAEAARVHYDDALAYASTDAAAARVRALISTLNARPH